MGLSTEERVAVQKLADWSDDKILEQKNAQAERELNRIILQTIYEKIDQALGEIAGQDYKRGVDRLRGILPKGYRHSFVKDKYG